MSKIKTLKRLPLFLAIMLIFNIGIGVDLPVFADSTKTYSYENFTIDYTVKTEWTGSQDIGVTVTNTSEEPLQGWAFEFEAGGEVKNVSGAEIYENEGTKYIIKSTSENNIIDPGKSITFGYTVIGTDITAPRAFRLVSKRVVLTDGYSVNIKSNANKKTDFEASISIKNTEKNPSGNNGKKKYGQKRHRSMDSIFRCEFQS
jgi:hypothetical protein